jgi:hypothetical protein
MRRLNGPIDVEFINRTFFPDVIVKDINRGRCFLWAYIAYRLYKNLKLRDMGAHAFVYSKDTKKFYDSQKSQGEADWKDLPATNFGVGCGCSKCALGKRKYKTAGKFRRSWKEMAKSFKVDWLKINQQIQDVLCQNLNSK